jgi:hypothetical protein
LLALALLPFALVFSRFERPKDTGGPPPAGWRQICGALLVCAGLAQLAKDGIAVPDGIGVRVEWVARSSLAPRWPGIGGAGGQGDGRSGRWSGGRTEPGEVTS